MDGILDDLFDFGKGLLTSGIKYGVDYAGAQYQNPQEALAAIDQALAQLAATQMSVDDLYTAIDQINAISVNYSPQAPDAQTVHTHANTVMNSLGRELRGEIAPGTTVRTYLGSSQLSLSPSTLIIGAGVLWLIFGRRRKSQ